MQVEPFVVEVNTPEEVLRKHIRENSKLPIPWVKTEEEHEGHAVICGSGPSLRDTLETIRWRKSLGQTIFALNGAAKFLASEGIEVDHHVMVDARPENKRFLGFAKHYLIASQCDPSLFSVKNVTLWQSITNGMEDEIPEVDFDYALIGGGTTVGLSAMSLAYTLGYRKLHLFGYDSSHKETGHAFKQSLNNNDPLCYVTFNGKRYKCSLAMAKQAELFPILAEALMDVGVTITVDGDGLLPDMVRAQPSLPEPEILAEHEKYQRMWDIPNYRAIAPGEHVAGVFCLAANPKPTDHVIDFGAGTGRGAAKIHKNRKCKVTMLDFADNCLDQEVRDGLADDFRFFKTDLTKPFHMPGDIGYCTDVMEHIPPEDVDTVLRNIFANTKKVFFQISTVPDHMGQLIGQHLHLTVKDFDWWSEKLSSYGEIAWSDQSEITALFYIDGNTSKDTHAGL
jgi:hypothetical protein